MSVTVSQNVTVTASTYNFNKVMQMIITARLKHYKYDKMLQMPLTANTFKWNKVK